MTRTAKTLEVKRHFDAVARRYDLMNTILSFGLHHLWKRRTIRLLGLKPGERVLDLCGGTGDLARLAAAQVGPEGRVLVYDLNRAMMAVGRPKAARRGLADRIHWVEGDAECLALPDAGVDAVVVGFGVRNLAHLEAGLGEMRRVLKPGGRLAVLEFSRPTPPLFRRLYDLYSFCLMPRLGQLLAGSREAYTYLITSIREFPLPETLSRLILDAGFTSVTYHPLTYGIAVIHLARA
uniref:Demethylmenaquinone methyltransferase n=1 Tax=Desulfobacca acetoxidans TaxID=60893 RepID=A0A7V4G9B7_9BACT